LEAASSKVGFQKWALAMVVNSKSTRAKKLKELLLNTSKEDGFTGEELHDVREFLFDVSDEMFEVVFTKLGFQDLPLAAIQVLIVLTHLVNGCSKYSFRFYDCIISRDNFKKFVT